MHRTHVKIVRDLVPEKIAKNGEIAEAIALDEEEFKSEILLKVREEIEEVVEEAKAGRMEGLTEEIGDALEALQACAGAYGIAWMDVLDAQRLKYERLGGFETRTFLVTTRSGSAP